MISESTETDSESVTEATASNISDGEWVSKQQAAFILKRSEKTVENWLKMGRLVGRISEGRREVFIKNKANTPNLFQNSTEAVPNQISDSVPKQSEAVENPYLLVIDEKSERIEELKNQVSILEGKLQERDDALAEMRDRLEAIRVEHGNLSGRLQTINDLLEEKDKTISAKDQAINAANAAVMLLEQRNQTLEAEEPKKLQGSQAQQADEKKGWFDKILGR